MPFPINNDPRADATIRGLALDRPELNIRRAERLSEWISLRNLILASPGHPDSLEAEKILRRRMTDSAEYAAMARRFFPEYR